MSGRLSPRGWHPAVVLGAAAPALAICFLAPPWALAALLAVLAWGLARRGTAPAAAAASLRPWLPIALLVLALHTVTTVSAAPLWHPSWAGLARGATVLARVAASIGCLLLLRRLLPLDRLLAAVGWWTRRPADGAAPVALALIVALGAAPAVVREGRRLEAMVRLRRGRGPAPRPWRAAWERVQLLPPLLETLFRRAETLPLALGGRWTGPDRLPRPPLRQLAALAVWTAAAAALALAR